MLRTTPLQRAILACVGLLALGAVGCGGQDAPADLPAGERTTTAFTTTAAGAAAPKQWPRLSDERSVPLASAEQASITIDPVFSSQDELPRRALALIGEAGQGVPAPGQKTIVLDPGHGGYRNNGATANGVAENWTNLDISLRVEEILREHGYHVVLTRRDERRSFLDQGGNNVTDLKARTELARLTDAALYVSIHSNANPHLDMRGVEAWYHPSIYGDGANERLGGMILDHVLRELEEYGYPSESYGARDDTCWHRDGSRCHSLYVLSPPVTLERDRVIAAGHDPARAGFRGDRHTLSKRGTLMPAVLMELLFISNEQDAAVLRDADGRQALARGVAQGIMAYLDAGESAVVAHGEG